MKKTSGKFNEGFCREHEGEEVLKLKSLHCVRSQNMRREANTVNTIILFVSRFWQISFVISTGGEREKRKPVNNILLFVSRFRSKRAATYAANIFATCVCMDQAAVFVTGERIVTCITLYGKN